MSLEALGDAAIAVSVIGTTMFIVGYLALAPWWRTPIGRSLVMSKSWIAALCWLAFLRTTLGVPEGNIAILLLRTVVWIMMPVISVYTFWALLVRGQIVRGRRKNVE